MRSIFKNLCIAFSLLFCSIFITSCNSDSNQNLNILQNFNELEYYESIGYFKPQDYEYITFETNSSNIVSADETILYKENSKVTLHLKNLKTTNVNLLASNLYPNYNFSDGTYLSGFNINGTFYDYENIENLQITLNSSTSIVPIKINFNIVGSFAYIISDYNTNASSVDNAYLSSVIEYKNNEISSKDKFLFYSYYKSGDFASISESNFATNACVNYNLTKANDTFDLSCDYELPNDATSVYVGAIIKDEENNYKFLIFDEVDEITNNFSQKIENLQGSENSISALTFNFTCSCFNNNY